MGRISVKQLRKKFYDKECKAHTKGTPPPKYFVVTNPYLFKTAIERVFDHKRATVEQRGLKGIGRLKRTEELLINALSRKPKKRAVQRAVHTRSVGSNNIDGTVDLVEIPVMNRILSLESALELTQNQIILFRCSTQPKGREISWELSLTPTDLEFIRRAGYSRDYTDSPIAELEDMMIIERDGTGLTTAKKDLRGREKEVPRCLRTLRNVAEATFKSWIDMCLISRGEQLIENTDQTGTQSYIDFARERGFISPTDFAQSKAFMVYGNAAVHHEYRTVSILGATLFLDWLSDLVDRTIGPHRLAKERPNGTSFSSTYSLPTDPQEFALRTAISDQLQLLRIEESVGESKRSIRLDQNGEGFSPEEVMEAAVKIANRIKEGGRIDFNKGERAVLGTMRFWEKALRGSGKKFTARDATRAALFAFYELTESRVTDPRGITGPTAFHTENPNYFIGAKRRGMGPRRIDVEKFNLREVESELENEFNLVSRVAHQYFPDHVQVSAHE